jgi:hypothetical protein
MPESLSGELFDHPTFSASIHLKTPASRGADLAFVRPIRRSLTHNLLKMNRLALCSHNIDFFGLVRPSPVGNRRSLSTTHNLQPTTRRVKHASLSCVTRAPPWRTTPLQ